MEEGLFRVPGMKTTIDAYHDAFEAGKTVDLSKELDPAAVAGLLKREIRHHGFPLDEASACALAPSTAVDAKGGIDRDAVTAALQAMDPSRAAGLRKLAVLLVSECCCL